MIKPLIVEELEQKEILFSRGYYVSKNHLGKYGFGAGKIEELLKESFLARVLSGVTVNDSGIPTPLLNPKQEINEYNEVDMVSDFVGYAMRLSPRRGVYILQRLLGKAYTLSGSPGENQLFGEIFDRRIEEFGGIKKELPIHIMSVDLEKFSEHRWKIKRPNLASLTERY